MALAGAGAPAFDRIARGRHRAGLGIPLSTIAYTQTQATQLSLLVRRTTAVQIARGLVLRGATVAQLWEPIAWLSVYTVVIVGLAVM